MNKVGYQDLNPSLVLPRASSEAAQTQRAVRDRGNRDLKHTDAAELTVGTFQHAGVVQVGVRGLESFDLVLRVQRAGAHSQHERQPSDSRTCRRPIARPSVARTW